MADAASVGCYNRPAMSDSNPYESPGIVFIALLYWAVKLRGNKESSQSGERVTPPLGGD